MANRLGRPIAFTLEPNVFSLFCHLTFGSAGAVTLDQGPYPQPFSKGFCNASLNVITSPSATTSNSTAVTGLTTLAGVFNGMSVTGTGIQAGTTVSAVDPAAGTLTLSQVATATGTPTLSFSGGQYIIQLGTQAGVRLDTWCHLLGLSHIWDEATPNAALAGASPASPAAPSMFLVKSNVAVRTIPGTSASQLTDASFTIQFGTFSAGTFLAANPASGEVCRLTAMLSQSGAI